MYSMGKQFVNATILNPMEVSAFGITYEVRLENYENVDGYARCIIIDKTNDERYHSEGYLEVNNHVVITRWKREYDYTRDNWICSKDLIVEFR